MALKLGLGEAVRVGHWDWLGVQLRDCELDRVSARLRVGVGDRVRDCEGLTVGDGLREWVRGALRVGVRVRVGEGDVEGVGEMVWVVEKETVRRAEGVRAETNHARSQKLGEVGGGNHTSNPPIPSHPHPRLPPGQLRHTQPFLGGWGR